MIKFFYFSTEAFKSVCVFFFLQGSTGIPGDRGSKGERVSSITLSK